MRIFHALGPGDVVKAHREQSQGGAISTETAVVYSGQFFEFCREHRIEALGISHHPRSDELTDGGLRIENRPKYLANRNGGLYHLSEILRAVYLAFRARRFNADLAIVDSGSTHYFALTAFWLLGIPVAINLHNTLWPNGFPETRGLGWFIRELDKLFFRYVLSICFGISPECRRQIQILAGRHIPFFDYRAQYHNVGFEREPRIASGDAAFRIAYVSRLAAEKGALDLIEIAQRLKGDNVIFDVCGDGPELERMRQMVADRGLGKSVVLHGYLSRSALVGIYANARAVIVPTRSGFSEGLPRACAEATMSGLPIITSTLSNALDVLHGIIIEAQPDDVASYVDAIRSLVASHQSYDDMVARCPTYAKQFYDRKLGYPVALDEAICHLNHKWSRLTTTDPIFARLI